MSRPRRFGGPGRKQGDAATDPVGTVRLSPDKDFVAVHWPSPPARESWAVMDRYGSVGYETPERVAHWPVVGAVPATPAAGFTLGEHPQESDGKAPAVRRVKAARKRPVETVELPGEAL